jgi:Leucine-rich repeat (LRR) protein
MKSIVIFICLVVVIAYVDFSLKNSSISFSTKEKADMAISDDVFDASGQNLLIIPADIFNRISLEVVNLSRNNIPSIPSEIGRLQKLTALDLSRNKLTDIPAEIGGLHDLEILNLADNRLTGLPKELGNLSKLKLLDISGNMYSEKDLDIIKKALPATTIIKTK